MSPSGVQKFLDGADPYAPTKRKLELWYVREGGGETSPGVALSALEVLLDGVPPAQWDRSARKLLRTLIREYSAAGSVPDWLEELKEALDESAKKK